MPGTERRADAMLSFGGVQEWCGCGRDEGGRAKEKFAGVGRGK